MKVRTRLLAAQQRQKTYANRRRRDLIFTPWERVLLSTKHLNLQTTSRKFADRFVGPF